MQLQHLRVRANQMTKNGDSLTAYLHTVKLYKEKSGLLHNHKEKKFLFFYWFVFP